MITGLESQYKELKNMKKRVFCSNCKFYDCGFNSFNEEYENCKHPNNYKSYDRYDCRHVKVIKRPEQKNANNDCCDYELKEKFFKRILKNWD